MEYNNNIAQITVTQGLFIKEFNKYVQFYSECFSTLIRRKAAEFAAYYIHVLLRYKSKRFIIALLFAGCVRETQEMFLV